jgi:crotonobetainyl-CoA:carnitine CoA-transferase CaiB-like acyl-CoA transferase
MMHQKGLLAGIVVADFTQLAQGPWATQMLGDMGADIIKIEPPKGDWMRSYAYGNHYPAGESISFLSFNRNKRSIVLDLKTEEGLMAAKGIIAKADLLIENFRPGVMGKLGLGYEIVKATNPGLIYCSSSGYGSDGPYKDRPGQDLLAQSISGTPYLNGNDEDRPVVTAVGQADLLTALFIVQSVLAALHYRTKTGMGQRLEACLINSIIAFHTQEITSYLYNKQVPQKSKSGIPNPWLGAPYGIYKTMDGNIAVGMNSIKKLGEILEIAELAQEQYNSNNIIEGRDQIYQVLQTRLVTKTTAEWLNILLKQDVWCSQVNKLPDMVNDPQVVFNEMIIGYDHPTAGHVETTGFPVKFSETPAAIYRAAPILGQHSAEIVKEFNLNS